MFSSDIDDFISSASSNAVHRYPSSNTRQPERHSYSASVQPSSLVDGDFRETAMSFVTSRAGTAIVPRSSIASFHSSSGSKSPSSSSRSLAHSPMESILVYDFNSSLSSTSRKSADVNKRQSDATVSASGETALTKPDKSIAAGSATTPHHRGSLRCPFCDKAFSNSSAIAKHKLTHSEERKYVCNICQKAFKRQDHLNGHRYTHETKKPHGCKFCDKSYSDARSLRRHYENAHSEEYERWLALVKATDGDTSAMAVAAAAALLSSATKGEAAAASPASPSSAPALEATGGGGASEVPVEVDAGLLIAVAANCRPPDSGDSSVGRSSGDQAVDRPILSSGETMVTSKRAWIGGFGSLPNFDRSSSPILPATGDSGSSALSTVVDMATAAKVALLISHPLEDPKRVACSVCQKRFKNHSALNGHMRLHGGYGATGTPAGAGVGAGSGSPLLAVSSAGVLPTTDSQPARQHQSGCCRLLAGEEHLYPIADWRLNFTQEGSPPARRSSEKPGRLGLKDLFPPSCSSSSAISSSSTGRASSEAMTGIVPAAAQPQQQQRQQYSPPPQTVTATAGSTPVVVAPPQATTTTATVVGRQAAAAGVPEQHWLPASVWSPQQAVPQHQRGASGKCSPPATPCTSPSSPASARPQSALVRKQPGENSRPANSLKQQDAASSWLANLMDSDDWWHPAESGVRSAYAPPPTQHNYHQQHRHQSSPVVPTSLLFPLAGAASGDGLPLVGDVKRRAKWAAERVKGSPCSSDYFGVDPKYDKAASGSVELNLEACCQPHRHWDDVDGAVKVAGCTLSSSSSSACGGERQHGRQCHSSHHDVVMPTGLELVHRATSSEKTADIVTMAATGDLSRTRSLMSSAGAANRSSTAAISSRDQAIVPVDSRPGTCHFTTDYCLTFPAGPGDQHLAKPPSHGALPVIYSSSHAQLMHQHPVENQYSPVTPAPGSCTTTNGEPNGSSNVFNFSCLPDSQVPLQQRHHRHQHLPVDCNSSQLDAGVATERFPAMSTASTSYSFGWPPPQEGPAGVVDLPPEGHAFFADSRAPPEPGHWYTPGNYSRRHKVFCGDFNSASSQQQQTSAGKTPVPSVCLLMLQQTSSPVHRGGYVGQALPQSHTYPYQLDYLGQPLQKRVYPVPSSAGEPSQKPRAQTCADFRPQLGSASGSNPAGSQCWGRQQQQGFGLPETDQSHHTPAEPWPTVLLHPPAKSTVDFASDQPVAVPLPVAPRAAQRPALSLPTFQSRWGAPGRWDSSAGRADVHTEPQRTRHISAPVIRSWANYSPQTSASQITATRPQPTADTAACQCPGGPCHLSSAGADVTMGPTAATATIGSVHLPWVEHALSGGGGADAEEANRQASRTTPALSSSPCPGQESWTKSCSGLPSDSLATSTYCSAWASDVTDLLMKSHITEPPASATACSSENVFAAICSRDSPALRVGGDWAAAADSNNKEDSRRQPLFISTPSPLLSTGSQGHQYCSPSGDHHRFHRQDLASPCSSVAVADVPMAVGAGASPSSTVVSELLTEERKCGVELLPLPSSAATSEAHRSLSQSMAEGTLFRNPQTMPPKTNKRKPAPIFIPPQTGANLSRLRSPRVWCPEVSPGGRNPVAALGCLVGDPPPYTPPPMLSPNRQGSGLFSSLVNSHWSPLVMRRCQHQVHSGLAGGSSCFCRRKPSGPAAASGGASSGTGSGNDGTISAQTADQQMLIGALKRSYGSKLATGAAADLEFVDDVVIRGATRPMIVARRQSTPKSAPVVLCQSYPTGPAGTVYSTVGSSKNNEFQSSPGQQQVVEMEVDGAVAVTIAASDPVTTDLLPLVEKKEAEEYRGAAEPSVVFGYDDETMRLFAEADAAADLARQSRRRMRRRRCDTEVRLASFSPSLEAASYCRQTGGESAAAAVDCVAPEGTAVLAVLNETAEEQEEEMMLITTRADLMMQAKGDESLECGEDEEEQDDEEDEEDEGLPSSLIPRINVGEAFQATIPAACNPRPAAEEYMPGEQETLLWHPSNLDDRDPSNMESLNLLTKIACSPAVRSCGLNMEYTFHLLCKYKGNLEKTLHALLHDSLVVYDYVYAETTVWTTEEIVRFQCGLARYGRDFYLIAKAMQASGMKKTVKACVEFYYVWKRMNTPSDVKLYRDRSTRRRARAGDEDALLLPVFPEEPVVELPTVYAPTTLEPGGGVRQVWDEASFGSVAMATASGAAAAPYNLRRKPPPALTSVALGLVASSTASGQQSSVTATANDELQHTWDAVPPPPPPLMMMVVDDTGFNNGRAPPPAAAAGLCIPSLPGDEDDDGDVELELEEEAGADELVVAFAEPQQLPADADCFLFPSPGKATGQPSGGNLFYPCRLCDRVFAKVKSRNAHMKSHSDHYRLQPQ